MIITAFYVILGLAALYWFLAGKKTKKGKRIAGPKGLPILGSFLEVNNENIHSKFMEYAQQFGEIFRLKMLSDNVVVLNSAEMIRKAFAGEQYKRFFGDRGEMFYGEHFRCQNQSLAFAADGSGHFHRTARKGYVQALHAYGSGIQELEKNVMTEMTNLLKRIEDMPGKEFACVEILQRSLANVISFLLSGETISDTDPDVNMFWDHVHANDFFLNSYANFVMTTFPFLRYLPGKYGDEFRHGKKANAKIAQRYFYDIKRTHVAGEVRGIVDYYLEEQRKQMESGNGVFFTDDRILPQLIETVDAGMTTSSSALINSMLVLMNYPEYQTKLQAELDREIGRDRLPTFADRDKCTFFKAFEMEVHRYLSVLPLSLPHLCREHVEFEGYDIEPNSTIFANIWYLHHNMETWGDPWNFRPERFLDEHENILPSDHALRRSLIAFGSGLRQCPGEMFAKTRYFLYIASLLQRWRFEFPVGKQTPCDPRAIENFDIKVILRAKPFVCCAKERL